MDGRLQRWTSIAAGAAVVGLSAWLAFLPTKARKLPAETDAGTTSATMASATATSASASPSSAPTIAAVGVEDAGSDLSLGLPSLFGDAGALPTGAPRTVRMGVVLVQYAGAEGAGGASRSKRDALEKAQKLLADAKADFKKTVREGDTGSSEDIGRIPRGVLDPRTEMAVFSLGPGDVSDVLETPKGYWIVKRIE